MIDCNEKPTWTLMSLLRRLPSIPADLRRVVPTLWGRPFDSRMRERLMIAVAAENRCRYCQVAHGAFGRWAGLSPGEVEAILGGRARESGEPRLEYGTSAINVTARAERPEDLAEAYVRDLARRAFTSRDEALRRRVAKHFTPQALEAMKSTARLMDLANRAGNTLDAVLCRLRAFL